MRHITAIVFFYPGNEPCCWCLRVLFTFDVEWDLEFSTVVLPTWPIDHTFPRKWYWLPGNVFLLLEAGCRLIDSFPWGAFTVEEVVAATVTFDKGTPTNSVDRDVISSQAKVKCLLKRIGLKKYRVTFSSCWLTGDRWLKCVPRLSSYDSELGS